MEYDIKKGGHKDMCRIYPMMEFDFLPFEMVRQAYLQRAMMTGAAELLLLKNENGLEIGYAVTYKKSLYGYVLLSYLAIYPPFRGKGAGTRFLALIRERYAFCRGILLEVAHDEAAAAKRRYNLYAAQGYEKVDCAYHIGGGETTLMCLRLMGKEDPAPAIVRIISDLYLKIIPERVFHKFLSVKTV